MADVNFANAVAAYAQGVGRATGGDDGPTAAQKAAGGPSFAQFVGDALVSARDTALAAERDSALAVKGQIGLNDLVVSVSNAEVSLESVLAVRDRVITAYQDILRMPI